MGVTAQSQLQKAELDAVLASGIFNRAPNLSRFLIYICERHFEGQAGQIKEYNIAVEALGRPADFDQKKDSIVRVEAHRLRKRLAEYYAAAGSDHAIQILIPNGQYAPSFAEKEGLVTVQPVQGWPSLAPIEVAAAPQVLPVWQSPLPPVRTPSPKLRAILLLGLVALAVFVSLWARRVHKPLAGSFFPNDEVWKGNSLDPVSSEFRMLAGYHGQPFTDRQGHKWQPDAYFNGGRSVSNVPPRALEGLPDPDLPQAMREGSFRYDIPVRPGTYELHLYFIESGTNTRNSSESDEVRSFQVNINGETKLDLFEALSEAGALNRLQVRVFKDIGPSKDGKVHLEFLAQTGQPILNGIEILSSVPGRIRPIRIVTHKTPVTDADGHVWAADEYVIGGHLVERSTSVSNLRQKNLYEGERFGNFAYHLPAAPGKYRLTLHFAETYFGGFLPNSPPFRKGARLFDVFVNGVALLRDFDIGETAGGPNRGIEQSFENLEPNAQGLIVVEFKTLRNYACVNALELEETS